MSSRWIIQDQASEKFFTSNSNEIWIPQENWTQPDQEFKCNVLYDQETDNGLVTYYEFKVASISGVGLTTKKHFAPGYKLKGLEYNSVGNLSDASCLLVGGFGSNWPESSKIVLIGQKKADGFQLYIVQDGRPLGLAFDLKSPIEEKLYPFVTFSQPGKACVSVSVRDSITSDSINRIPTNYQGIEGYWELTEYCRTKPINGHIANIKKRSESNYDFGLTVINRLGGTLTRGNDGQHFKVGQCFSTLMAGPPNLMKEESKIFSMFKGSVKIDLANNDSIVITTDSGDLKFKRYAKPPPKPCTSNPFQ